MELIPSAVDSTDSALAAFLSTAELEDHLVLLSDDEWGWGRVQQVRTRVLKCHPDSRCTFEILMTTDRGPHELIGKVFAEDRPDIYDAMVGIQRAGLGGDSRFAIPEPMAYLRSLRLLLEEKTNGTSVRDILLTAETSKQKAAAIRCAHWLAKFHAMVPRIGPVTSVNKLMSKSNSQARKLARFGGYFAEKSAELLARLEGCASKLGLVEICASHGEYSPSHVLLADDDTVVIDWDKCQLKDPARDVATFVVLTKWLALDRRGAMGAFDQVIDVFLQTYVAERGTDILERLSFHKAAVFLKQAKYCAAYQFENWKKKTMAMLDEGLCEVG